MVSPTQLLEQYNNWLVLLKADKDASLGYSVFGWLKSWFNIDVAKNLVLSVGLIINLLPLLIKKSLYNKNFQLLYMASLLIWVVIFNHKAESPTFIIATTGVAIWYALSAKTIVDKCILFLVFVFTILSPTDIFPKSLNTNFVIPFVLKGVACIFVWFKIMYDLFMFRSNNLSKH